MPAGHGPDRGVVARRTRPDHDASVSLVLAGYGLDRGIVARQTRPDHDATVSFMPAGHGHDCGVDACRTRPGRDARWYLGVARAFRPSPGTAQSGRRRLAFGRAAAGLAGLSGA